MLDTLRASVTASSLGEIKSRWLVKNIEKKGAKALILI